MQLLTIFIVLSILNVILNTIKSIVTVNGGKMAAALINAITFFVYTYVIIYTNCELSMHLKAVITAIVNFIGVYIVKLVEEKSRKDKLWKVEATVNGIEPYNELKEHDISCNCFYTTRKNEYIINCFCKTQKESAVVKKILDKHHAKYFVSESKTL